MNAHRSFIPAIALAVTALFATEARAVCGGSVSASVSGTTLTITATANGSCGGSAMGVFIDGGQIGHFGCDTNTCTKTFTLSSTCYRTGSHSVTAVSTCNKLKNNDDGTQSCVGDDPKNSATSFSVNTTPTVGASHASLDDLGNGQLTVNYNFPNTDDYWQRWLGVYVDGSLWLQHRPEGPQSGAWTPELDTTCWSTGSHTIKARAVACDAFGDPDYDVENQTAVSVNTTPTVSVSHSKLDDLGNGTLTVPYHFPNTQGYWQRWIGIYIDGTFWASHRSDDNQGVATWELDTTCWGTGPHKIEARAVACDAFNNPLFDQKSETSVNVNTTPTVSVSHSKLDDLGNGTLTVPYHFPNTQGYWQRWIGIYVDGNLWAQHRPDNNQGVATWEMDTTCWGTGAHKIEARAVACDGFNNPLFDQKSETSVSVNTTPTVSVSHSKLDDLGNGTLTVPYHFPNTQGYWQRWIGIYIDGTFWTAHRPDDNQGVATWELDTTCWGTGTHKIEARAVACDGFDNPLFDQKSETSVSVNTTPTVSATYVKLDEQGNGRLDVTYHFPNTQHSYQRWIGIYIDGSFWTLRRPDDNQGTTSWELDSSCWKTGSHTIKAVAVACDAFGNPLFTAENETAVEVDTKPDVSLTVSDPDTSGNVTVTIPYEFPNTQYSWQRWIGFYVNGAQSSTHRPETMSGTWTFTVNAACARPLYKAVGVACDQFSDPELRDEDEKQLSASSKPSVGITWTGPDTNGNYTATVTWGFPGPGSRLVEVYQNGGRIMSFQPAAASGSTTFPVGCGELRAVAIACGRADDPDFTAESWTTVPPDACKEDRSWCDVSAGRPVNIGSGDVSVTVPLFDLDSPVLPLRFGLEYHSARPIYPSLASEMGPGWSHTYGETLRAADPQAARLYRLTARGREYVYERLGTGDTWIAVRPLDVEETVTLADGAYRIAQLDGTTLSFSASTGHWLSTEDRWGNRISASYDPSGNLTGITDADGRVITVQATGVVPSTITLPNGATWRFSYTGGNLSAIFDPLHGGATAWRTFQYQNDSIGKPRLLTAMRDDAGKLLEGHTYDAQDRGLSSFVEGNRELVTIEYDTPAAGKTRVTHRIDASTTQVTVVELDYKPGKFLPLQATGTCLTCGGASETQTAEYDADGRVRKRIDGEGNISLYTYDAYGNVLTETTAAGTADERTVTHEYADPRWPTFPTRTSESSVTGTGTKVTTQNWNAGFTVLTATESGMLDAQTPASRTTVRTFDPRGRMLSFDGPRTDVADVSTRAYYGDAEADANRRGRLLRTANALGHETTFDSYDVFGNVLRTIDPNGVVSEVETDLRGRVTRQIVQGTAGQPDSVRSTTFDSRDRRISATDPLGNVTRFTWEDGTNWLTATTRVDAAGKEMERQFLTLNGLGQKTKEELQSCTTPASTCTAWTTRRTQSFVYDSHARLKEVVEADGAKTVYSHDENGRVRTVQDPNHTSANTTYIYDAFGRVKAVTQKLGSGTAVTGYDYDVQGNLESVTDPNGNVTQYEYDDFGQLQKKISPVSGTTEYDYDRTGNLLETADANGAVTTRTYDVENRIRSSVSSRAGAATETVQWTYDAGSFGIGRLSAMTDPTGTTQYGYDHQGRLSSETRVISGTAYATAYGYDVAGNRTSMTYPSGMAVQYTYDFAGRPVTAHAGAMPVVTSATYLPFGPVSEIVFGNGTTRTMTYDSRYRPLTNALAGPAGPIASYEYGHDAAGNVTRLDDVLSPAYNRAFGYDDLNRLTSANTGASLWGTGTFAYDPMGNLTGAVLGTRTRSFTYSGTTPKLATVTENGVTRGVTYDAAGNEQLVGAEAFDYTARNSLGAADAATYAYDGRGVRTIAVHLPELASVSIEPATLYTGQSAVGTVMLTQPAPAGGADVTLSSSNPGVLVPASVTVAELAMQATFAIGLDPAVSAGAATITATQRTTRTAQVDVIAGPALVSVTLSPSSVTGGQNAMATVTLASPAPPGGATVALSASSGVVSIAPSVTIAAGDSSATVTVSTHAVATAATVVLTATYGASTASGTLEVRPPVLVGLDVTPANVTGGQPVNGVVTLDSPAPAGGMTVALSSSNGTAAAVPASAAVAAGQTTGTFTIATTPQTSPVNVTIGAALNGVSRTAPLTVSPCAPAFAPPPVIPAGETIWVDDSLPAGAFLQNGYHGPFHWDTSQRASGTASLTHTYDGPRHYETHVNGLNEPLHFGESLVLYFRVSECNVPREISLWFDTDLNQANVYWGERLMGGEQKSMGPIPAAAGDWIRIAIPLSELKLETHTLKRIRLAHHSGEMWFDRIGKAGPACIEPMEPPPVIPAGETIWVDEADSLAAGVALQNGYNGPFHWDTSQRASGSAALTHSYHGALHYESHVTGLNETLHFGESAVLYFRVNECAIPREISLWFDTDRNQANVYWGERLMGGEQKSMGPIPTPTGDWIRVEIPWSELRLETHTLKRIRLSHHSGQLWWDRIGKAGTACIEPTEPPPAIPAGETIWVDDSLPTGASLQNGYNGPFHWDTSQHASGTAALTHSYNGPIHYESHINLSEVLHFGESAVLYFRVNECAVPREINLWFDTDRTQANVYWGERLMGGEQKSMGPIPTPTGDWIRVEIPWSELRLETHTLKRIRLSNHSGQLWWDRIGKAGTACIEPTEPPPVIPAGETIWVDDSLPAGASLQNGYNGPAKWDTSQHASGAAALSHSYNGPIHYESHINGLNELLHFGESAVLYFRVNECAVPREISVFFDTDRTQANVYWGERLMGGEQKSMGSIPAPSGDWVRIEIPWSELKLETHTLKRIRLVHHSGQMWFDRIGKAGTACIEETEPQPEIPAGEVIWIDDTLPAGASLQNGYYGPLRWDTSQYASGTASLAHVYNGPLHYESHITGLNQLLQTGDSAVVYFRVNECAVPRQISIFWDTNQGPSNFYWGEQLMGGEQKSMGPVPSTGEWVRVEIPLSELNLEQKTLTRLRLVHHSGQMWFDRIGIMPAIAPTTLTAFTASHASPQPAGTAITWTATATGSVMPLEYQFERQDAGTWSVVQAYGAANTYTWTPAAADAGEHAVRVLVRNGGSTASFDDVDTLPITITSGGASLRRNYLELLLANARQLVASAEPRPPISMSVTMRPIADSATTERHYLYTPELSLMAEATVANDTRTIQHEYVWFAGQPIAQIEPASGAVHTYFNDHLGTPILTTDATGTVDWRVEREPYGRILETRTGATRHQPLAFPGQEDSSSERSYNVFRWYRSGWGRYTQADPIGLAGGINVYAYVEGSPVNLTDPTGLQTRSDRWYPSKTPQQLEREKQRKCANDAFWDAYDDMKEANWKKSDKYFHCRANCDATRCGPSGYDVACEMSDFREWFDQTFKGDSAKQSEADQIANRFGRSQAKKYPNQSCKILCGPYRPKGLPGQY